MQKIGGAENSFSTLAPDMLSISASVGTSVPSIKAATHEHYAGEYASMRQHLKDSGYKPVKRYGKNGLSKKFNFKNDSVSAPRTHTVFVDSDGSFQHSTGPKHSSGRMYGIKALKRITEHLTK
jgi:hypothetical protein